MRDDLAFAERISRDLAAVDWPAPADIRARARWRTLATSVSASLAVLVINAVVSALVVIGHHRPSEIHNQPPQAWSSQVRSRYPDDQHEAPDQARTLGRRAAARLCVAANPGC